MEQKNYNQNTALLVMDVQSAIVSRLKDTTSFFHSINNALQMARDKKMPVIYVVVGFRKGYPEASLNNKAFSVIKNGTMNSDTEEAMQIHASVAPLPDDIIVIKKRVSAFSGSDL
jgi:nicotinamidase-related amidase